MSEKLGPQAEALAETIHGLTQWSKSHPNARRTALALFKLPPVFTAVADSKYGNGRKNLEAMIKTLADYEEGEDLTLAELPKRYNAYGGQPGLSDRDLRRVHGWLQTVSFAVRAAMLEQEDRSERTASARPRNSVASRVAKRLFGGETKRTFVTHAPGSRYEMKPLRYASQDAIERWISQEYAQRLACKRGDEIIYGAQPTEAEWDAFGLRGQTRTLMAQIQTEIETLISEAAMHDRAGQFQEADALDYRLKQMKRSLESLNKEASIS